jgi:hypothetical protein
MVELNSKIVEISAWAISMALHSDNYGSYQDKLIQLITPDDIMSVKSFHKNYNKDIPTGVVIETKDYIMVSYRGTRITNPWEIFHDSQLHRRNMKFGNQNHLIHSGFVTEYEESKESLKKTLAETSSNKPIIFCGHSLGGALSNIAALDFTTNKVMGSTEVGGVVTFGAPRVFSHRAANFYNQLGLGEKTIRVVQKGDPIPEIAPYSLYKHTGKKVEIAGFKGPTHSSKAYRHIASKLKDNHIEKAYKGDDFEKYLGRILTMVRDKILLFTGNISKKEYTSRENARRMRQFQENINMYKTT